MELIGVDIGGTNIKVGRVKDADIEKEVSVGVNIQNPAKKTLDDLFKTINAVITPAVTGIGVGVPAVVDPLTGVVYDVQNIPEWKEVALKKILEERFKLPVFVNNDANCFAIGEKIFGKGRQHNNFVGLTLGTGLGMGIIINGRLYNGVLCGAGEIGMIPYKEGIMEHYAGSFFFTRKYEVSGKELSERAGNNDPLALKAFEEYGMHLGEAVKSILYLFAPEAIIMGGSISKAYPFFEKALAKSLESFAYPKQIENLVVATSGKPGLAILGAASLCLQS